MVFDGDDVAALVADFKKVGFEELVVADLGGKHGILAHHLDPGRYKGLVLVALPAFETDTPGESRVRTVGLEPTRLTAPASKTGMSTNFITSALVYQKSYPYTQIVFKFEGLSDFSAPVDAGLRLSTNPENSLKSVNQVGYRFFHNRP